MNLPNGLLPMQDMLECGYVKELALFGSNPRKKQSTNLKKLEDQSNMQLKSQLMLSPIRSRNLLGLKLKSYLCG
ncbi:hypothetical protein RDI58_004371 [Solanum bulbocastanum]|uniref:Uncharacterized protein n=1 Tax=Solanum bulbocastanum TaxID=147425 RepID=A0AAN8TYY7_SOLBU